MASNSSSVTQPLLTADGTPLKVSLKRSMRRSKLKAMGLVLPPLLFLLLLFIIPIGNLLTRSVDDKLINFQMPLTFRLIENWDRQTLPEEELYKNVFYDLATINKFLISKNIGSEVDLEDSGWFVRIPKRGPYKEPILKINPQWGEVGKWMPLSDIVQESLKYEGTKKEKKGVEKRAQFKICSYLTPLTNAACSRLFKVLKGWDQKRSPDENFFKALYKDLISAQKFLHP